MFSTPWWGAYFQAKPAPRAAARLGLELLEDRVAPAGLDPFFGNGGKVTANFSQGAASANAMAVQGDGKILLAGGTYDPSTRVLIDFALARFNPDGTPDTAFGPQGEKTVDLFGGSDTATCLAVRADGKFLVGGYSSRSGTGTDFALAQFNLDGTLDTSFGTGGKVATDFSGGDDRAESMALQPDGKIVLGGSATTGTGADFALARYNPDGSLDPSFGGNGKVTFDFFGGNDNAYAILLQRDGKILIGGGCSQVQGPYSLALARVNPNGALDASFGQGGKDALLSDYVSHSFHTLALQPDGKILAGGGYPYESAFDLARYNPDGTLDASFHNGGYVSFVDTGSSGGFIGSEYPISGILVQPDGRILLANSTYSGSNPNTLDFTLSRLTPSGYADTTGSPPVYFDLADFNHNDDIATSAALQPDGKVLLAGFSQDAFGKVIGMDLARYDIGLVIPAAVVQFAVTDFTAPEFGGAAQVVITRTGSTSGLTQVTFSTGDGTALNGRDYTSTAASLVFAPGETTATVFVPVLDNHISDGNRQVNLLLFNLSPGAIFGATANAVLTIIDDEPNDNARFVSGLYQELLQRPLDGPGYSYYAPPLEAARSQALPFVVALFTSSQEYQAHLLNDPTTGYYPRFLGRLASAADLAYFASVTTAGATDEQFQAALLGSPEYLNHVGGLAVYWLQNTFSLVLGRPLDGTSQTYFLGQLNAGLSFQFVATELLSTAEHQNRLVEGYFSSFLHRPASGAELSFWAGALAGGAHDEDVIRAVAGSQECLANNGGANSPWIQNLFLSLLGRQADPAGLEFFTNQALGGYAAAREFVALSLTQSSEYRALLINRDYEQLLKRPATGSDIAFWTSQLNAGLSAEGLAAGIAGSGEFFVLNGNENTSWLQAVYANPILLDRPLDPAGQAYYLGLLNGGASRPTVVQQILASTEYRNNLISTEYEVLLGRPAGDDDKAYWNSQFQQGIGDELFIALLAGSQEYFSR